MGSYGFSETFLLACRVFFFPGDFALEALSLSAAYFFWVEKTGTVSPLFRRWFFPLSGARGSLFFLSPNGPVPFTRRTPFVFTDAESSLPKLTLLPEAPFSWEVLRVYQLSVGGQPFHDGFPLNFMSTVLCPFLGR